MYTSSETLVCDMITGYFYTAFSPSCSEGAGLSSRVLFTGF